MHRQVPNVRFEMQLFCVCPSVFVWKEIGIPEEFTSHPSFASQHSCS